jgi:hypothetical protein
MGTDGLVTSAKAAEHLGAPLGWLHDNWRRVGLPAIRVGNRINFRLSELDRWIEQNRETPSQHTGAAR